MYSVGAIIFSRMDSKRLPGKALRNIAGRKLLGRVLDRAANLSSVNQVIVATSTREIDDEIVQYVHGEGYKTFRGDADNVALRAVEACEQFGWDGFARICGDRPFFDPVILDQAVTMFKRGGVDLVTTSGEHPLPPGLTVEIIRCGALKEHLDDFTCSNKEHVSSFFYEHLSKFTICYADHPSLAKARFNTRLVVDDDVDMDRAEWIVNCLAQLKPAEYSDAQQVLKIACEWDAKMLTTTAKSGN